MTIHGHVFSVLRQKCWKCDAALCDVEFSDPPWHCGQDRPKRKRAKVK